ncbi:MBL fold metallo-hydrolase [Pelomyxa schiedti]|nr:MBL fold metallo-hydrolase [Pelomyxa schiedti]
MQSAATESTESSAATEAVATARTAVGPTPLVGVLVSRPQSAWKTWKMPGRELTFSGYTRAATASSFWVKELKLFLDCGALEGNMNPRHVFITHTHLDHVKEAHMLLTHLFPINYYLPTQATPFFEAYLKTAHELNTVATAPSTCPLVIHGVVPGSTFDLPGGYKVKVIATDHAIPSVGYCFYLVKTKLKAEYTGQDIAALRRNGVEVLQEIVEPLFVYLGDTTHQVFESHPEILDFPFVFTECTYLHADEDLLANASNYGHAHFDGLKPYIESAKGCTFILTHFSMRYSEEEVREFFVQKRLPNVIPWVS